jgi:hypothetical protein
MVLAKYGETRADGVRRVYSFPIVFFGDDADSVSCQRFESWRMGKLHRWSQRLPDNDRHCMAMEEIKPNPKASRRRWGGRSQLDMGLCDPNNCGLFREDQCKYGIELYFRIPGIPTGSMFFALKTHSIYSLLELTGDPDDPGSAGILDYVKRDFGRIAGLFGGKPMFTITKTLDEVSRMDWQAGKQFKEKKEIIHLVTHGVDTIALLEGRDATQAASLALLERLEAAKAAPEPAPEPAPEIVDDPAVTALRAELWNVLKQFAPPWAGDDLKEYLKDTGIDETAVHEEAPLKDIIAQLRQMQDAGKKSDD